MAKPRRCPHCKASIGKNFIFDEKLNLICFKCRKVVYPTSEEDDDKHPIFPASQNVNPNTNYRYNKKVD